LPGSHGTSSLLASPGVSSPCNATPWRANGARAGSRPCSSSPWGLARSGLRGRASWQVHAASGTPLSAASTARRRQMSTANRSRMPRSPSGLQSCTLRRESRCHTDNQLQRRSCGWPRGEPLRREQRREPPQSQPVPAERRGARRCAHHLERDAQPAPFRRFSCLGRMLPTAWCSSTASWRGRPDPRGPLVRSARTLDGLASLERGSNAKGAPGAVRRSAVEARSAILKRLRVSEDRRSAAARRQRAPRSHGCCSGSPRAPSRGKRVSSINGAPMRLERPTALAALRRGRRRWRRCRSVASAFRPRASHGRQRAT